MAGLQARLSALEEAAPAPVAPPADERIAEPALDPLVPDARAVSGALTETGRCILVAAGGFLVRAITDSGTIPRSVGAAAGLAYAVAWILLADRAAARGRRRTASFLSITAVILAYPLLFETTARMGVFTPVGASAAIAILTALVLGVASRRDLLAVGWLAVLAEAATAALLGFTTGRPEPFAAACALIAAATAFLGDTWEGAEALRWPAALVADVLVLWTALRLEDLPAESLPPTLVVFALAAALGLGPLAWVTWRTLRRGRPLGSFEAIQVTVSLAIGIVAGFEVTRVAPASVPWLGLTLFAAAAACLVVARVAARVPPRGAALLLLYATWAAGLSLAAGWTLPGALARTLLWSLLGVAAAVAARRSGRGALDIHAALFVLAAALQSGLLAASLKALLLATSETWGLVPSSGWIALAAAGAAYLLLDRREAVPGAAVLSASLVLAAVGALGLAALAVVGLRALWPGDDATLAAVRTAVLSAAAVTLAWARRRSSRAELSWLAAAVLVTGAAKLLFEDLPHGRSLTLFAGFVLYGVGLLGAQRLLRSKETAAA